MEDAPKGAMGMRMGPLTAAHVHVFIASFSLMVIEVVAGRLIAPYLGVSLYSWTSVIGVVLAGIAAGNWVGGVLAERGAGSRELGIIFFVAGFVTAGARYLAAIVGPTMRFVMPTVPLETLAFSLVVFFPISFLLSLVTPVAVTSSLTSLRKAGTTIGGIYAVSAIASILGTFSAGFYLIAFFGVESIMLTIGGMLALAGIFVARAARLAESAAGVALVAMLWGNFFMPKLCDRESGYYCLKVFAVQSEHFGEGYALKLDRLVHSFMYDDPRKLDYEYEVAYAAVAEYLSQKNGSQPLQVAYMGGGGYTMPRYLAQRFPGIRSKVIEIDPEVTRLVERHYGQEALDGIASINEDARIYFARHAGAQRFDIVYGDAFNDFSVPFHLTTREFDETVRSHLAPGGIYAVNIIDNNEQGRALASFVRTLGGVFRHVKVVAPMKEWQTYRRMTFVILASDEKIDERAWSAAARAAFAVSLPDPEMGDGSQLGVFLSDEETERFTAEKRGIVLTDDHAPVDNFLAALVRKRR